MDAIPGYQPIPESWVGPMPGAKTIGSADPHERIEVTIKLRRKQTLPEITGRPVKLMTREQLADAYGASQQDIDAVIETYTQLGLKNTFTDAATRTVKFSGSVAEMENAFQVKLFDYTHPDGNYRGREGYVYIPKSLSSIIEAVFGLDNRRIAHRRDDDIAPAN
jgi:kumamolisin